MKLENSVVCYIYICVLHFLKIKIILTLKYLTGMVDKILFKASHPPCWKAGEIKCCPKLILFFLLKNTPSLLKKGILSFSGISLSLWDNTCYNNIPKQMFWIARRIKLKAFKGRLTPDFKTIPGLL